jgi:predicted DNA-binding transcriptional regulator AlpA
MSAKDIQRAEPLGATRKSPRILSYSDLRDRGIKFSRQWILQLMKEKKFPQTIALGAGHSVGFIETEIDKWIEDRIAERDNSGFTDRLDDLNEKKKLKAKRDKDRGVKP